jgi:hypothetical protein
MAVIYVRQSTLGQVVGNLESQRRQYDLAGAARATGFASVKVIDDDLSRSGSGTVERPAEFAELREHHANGLLNVLVRINLDLAGFAPTEARGQHKLELAAPRLRVARGPSALPHQAEFVLRHRAFQAKQQAIVDDSRIVRASGSTTSVPARAHSSIR